MDILDFLLFFIYIFIFSFLFSLQRKKIKDAKIRSFHKYAFWVKVFSCFCYSMFVLYVSIGDTTALFYPEGHHWYQSILNDSTNLEFLFGPSINIEDTQIGNPIYIGYYGDESNFMVIKLTALISFLCFGKYLVVNLVFAMIAFSGIWKLYEFFIVQYPDLKKQFAIAILFLPTLTFWSSGILKDSLSIAALGWFTYSIYQLVYHKKNLISNTIMILLCLYVFSIVKVYILVAYLPAFCIFLLLKNAMLLKSPIARASLILIFIVGSSFTFIALSSTMGEVVADYTGGDISEGVGNYQKNYDKQKQKVDGSYFSLGIEFDGSPGSLIKIAPYAIVTTFFRPFLWESRNISTLLSSFESFALIILTLRLLYKIGFIKSFKTIFKQPIILYCIFFSLVFGIFIGATTLNFGTLVRYKIPAMPFYVCSIILIFYHNGKIKSDTSIKQD